LGANVALEAALTAPERVRSLALLVWLPRAEELAVPGVGHLLQLADPRAVAEGLAAFLARQRP
jgi:pimeloyl-ACP methyl ester carboxylesterase